MAEINVFGLRDTMRALKSLDEKMFNEMDSRFKAIFEPLVGAARSNVPGNVMSGWGHKGSGEWGGRLRWDPQKVRNGIKIKTSFKGPQRGRAVSAQYLLVNSTAAGALFELAGANRSNPPKNRRGSTAGSAQFIANAQRYGRPNRVIWRAWDKLRGDAKTRDAIIQAVRASEREVQAALDRVQGKAA